VPLPILLSIRIVPIKARTLIQKVVTVRHIFQYTIDVYTI
jgi:hypothetical protein